MNLFPLRNLFSNPSSPQTFEPKLCKKLFFNPPYTPEFGNQIRQPIKLQVREGIGNEQKKQLALKIYQQQKQKNQYDQINSPHTPKKMRLNYLNHQERKQAKSNQQEKSNQKFEQVISWGIRGSKKQILRIIYISEFFGQWLSWISLYMQKQIYKLNLCNKVYKNKKQQIKY
ncbi:unnamed protein product [Paramecium primaurelia]|uniref:Uncharacterized protein n=1 Tax=Paramecium primaurelia TaxID=5886 RepID=A0A8S1KK17_PARPR|nr:unnamed protein product [Paramecium primaurelia]